jgi:hypothetical protein
MMPNLFMLISSPKLRLRGILLVLAAVALGGAALLWAQPDTPIVIGDGSLTMESRGVAWSAFTGSGRVRVHPHTGKRVPTVSVTMPSLPGNHTQILTFNNQRVTVTVEYASTTITVTTGNNGRRLEVDTDFSSFRQGATPNLLVHNNANAKISRVTVRRGNQTVFDRPGNGGTQVVIGYQQ